MTLSNSLSAYRDCKELFESAAEDDAGARALLRSSDHGTNLRMRMNYFRKLDRKANAEIYQPGHPLHGASAYDEFAISLAQDTNGEWWIYVQRRQSMLGVVEKLSEVAEPGDD